MTLPLAFGISIRGTLFCGLCINKKYISGHTAGFSGNLEKKLGELTQYLSGLSIGGPMIVPWKGKIFLVPPCIVTASTISCQGSMLPSKPSKRRREIIDVETVEENDRRGNKKLRAKPVPPAPSKEQSSGTSHSPSKKPLIGDFMDVSQLLDNDNMPRSPSDDQREQKGKVCRDQ